MNVVAHDLVYDTVTWKFPRASAIALFLIVSSILASQFVNFSRFVFRILWLSFASTATIEAISKLVTGRGIVRYPLRKSFSNLKWFEASSILSSQQKYVRRSFQ